jgi:hypothetical protein
MDANNDRGVLFRAFLPTMFLMSAHHRPRLDAGDAMMAARIACSPTWL